LATKPRSAKDAANNRYGAAKRSREEHASISEIGDIPAVVNPERRAKAMESLEFFLCEYFPGTTGLSPFSDDHKTMIRRMETAIRRGGRVGNAVYRGFAKTTISENAAIWAIAFSFRKFVSIFGADATAAERIISSIKTELEENDLLAEDFPEMCYPIRALEGKWQRCGSQTQNGTLTHIEWKANTIVLANIDKAACSSAIISCHGIESASRGLKYKRADGIQARPDLAIVDDPQTDKSADSGPLTYKRMNALTKNIMRQGGHMGSLAIIINATPIKAGDMVEQLNDRKRFPAFKWFRAPMVRAWGTAHETLWPQYRDILFSSNPDIEDDDQRARQAANNFYEANRQAMDDGVQVSWKSCYTQPNENDPIGELSAIQHAYNILFVDGEDVFATECQMEVSKPDELEQQITSHQIMAKANRLPRRVAPESHHMVTIGVDVQSDALYWAACSFGDGFSAQLLDYGVYPEQPDANFDYRKLRRKLSDTYQGETEQGRVFAAIKRFAGIAASIPFQIQGGSETTAALIGVDSGDNTQSVYQAIKACGHPQTVFPTKGRYIGAKRKQWDEFTAKPGVRIDKAYQWSIGKTEGSGTLSVVQFNTNFWKSFVMSRLRTPEGEASSFGLCGEPREHDELAMHLTSEKCDRIVANDRVAVDEWSMIPNRQNHLLDAVVLCFMLASTRGIALPGLAPAPNKPERRLVTIPKW
jgi:hypothetical protein